MPETPQWIIARLGEDFNWWLESTSDSPADQAPRGMLDPRQVAHLAEALKEYEAYGLRRQLLDQAFTLFALQAEIEEGRVRLAWSEGDNFSENADVFALPVLNDRDGDSPYGEFLETLAAARVRKLNATHSYVQACTADELYEELDALDSDRYFSEESRHCFDEINEILMWSPAEWDDPSAA